MSQSNPMAKKVITRDEALKILNMAEKTELNPDEIMEVRY